VLGDYAYLVDDKSGLQVIDVSDPASPRRVGGNSAYFAVDVAVYGDNVFVAGGADGLVIFETFRPPLRLAVPRLSLEGPLTISVAGPAGSTARLQRSTNLREWEDWVVLPLGEQPTEIGDPEAGIAPQRFYRAVER
jgi:hypothetical protein